MKTAAMRVSLMARQEIDMIKVMTLNLNYYGTRLGAWSIRRELVAAAIREARPDVIALQAVCADPAVQGGADQAAQLSEILPEYPHHVFRAASRSLAGAADGSAFLSRIALAQADARALSLRPGLEDTNTRQILNVQIDLPSLDLPGGPLHLFNAHFSWVPEQAGDNVREALAYLDSFTGLRLLAGDLNCTPDLPPMQALRDAGWADLWAELHGPEPGYTFPSDDLELRIDYFWASPELASRALAIDLVAQSSDGGARPSDHLGLMVTLDLRA